MTVRSCFVRPGRQNCIDDVEAWTETLGEDDIRTDNEKLHEENDRLRDRVADLEVRLDRIEAHLGSTRAITEYRR